MPHRKRSKEEIVSAIRRLEQNRENIEAALKALRNAYVEIDQGGKPSLADKYQRSHTPTGTYRRLRTVPSPSDGGGDEGVVEEGS
jgi:hypothetical protein